MLDQTISFVKENNVKTLAVLAVPTLFHEKIPGRINNLLLFPRSDGVLKGGRGTSVPPFHLNKHHRTGSLTYNIDLSTHTPEVSFENGVTF
jgi:hypothetical protein